MAFPLFNLPLVVLSEVLSHIEIHDLIKLSVCSIKTQKITKLVFKPSKPIPIEVFYGKRPTIGIVRKEEYYPFEGFKIFEMSDLPNDEKHDILRICGYNIPAIESSYPNSGVKTYWENKLIGIKVLGNYVKHLLKSPIHTLTISIFDDPETPKKILDWINEGQTSIATCRYGNESVLDENAKYYLDNLNVTKEFYIEFIPSYDFHHSTSFQTDLLIVRYGHWIKIDNLLSMNCRFVEILSSEFTGTEFNKFLKHWQNGGCSRLEFLAARVWQTESITEGIEVVRHGNEVERVFTSIDGDRWPIRGGIDFRRRNDGKIATLLIEGKRNIKHIRFLTWPDWINNSYNL